MKKYEIVNFIGEGQYSSIFRVRNIDEKIDYILKKLKFHSEEEAKIKKVFEKFQKISAIDHPNIIKYHKIAYDEKEKAFR